MTITDPTHPAEAPAEPSPLGDVVAPPPECPRPNGGAAAALVASGVGASLLGLLVVLADANERVHSLLTFYAPVGPLSGKTTVAVAGWLLAWLVLHQALRRRDVELRPYLRVTMVLVALGFVGTFPPFYGLFAP